VSRLDLVVGPNGAGKTSFIGSILALALPMSEIVNADQIAAIRWPGTESAHAYEAAGIAADTRSALIRSSRPFIAETVFSHESKLTLVDDARAHGYHVALHVLLVPIDLAVERVRHRVAAGGHAVPEQKIRDRFERLWPLVASAAVRCHTARVWDNSGLGGPRPVAALESGHLVGAAAWPAWAPPELARRWPND
jgi:predicted ABC-type ATPase